MRRIVVGNCVKERLLRLVDPDAPTEAEFEQQVVRALSCFFPNHQCIVFTGGFRLDGEVLRPDLALFPADYSHWFVVEVELTSHSFERHVLPQVRAFRYGEPLDDCASQIAKALNISVPQATTLVRHVPRNVAVVMNKREPTWEIALRSHSIQLLIVSAFSSEAGLDAVELDGDLEVFQESLGFGLYSATDRSLRFPTSVRLPTGRIQIHDPLGSTSLWTVARDGVYAWITKDVGLPSIPHDSHIQLLRTVDGRITLKRP
ncbi:MAG TPA: hypothetical protein VFB02_06760 [Bradyrhizobium sp.]|nr:hypothetical protein [Bradyrhizobium sp.]